MISMGKKSGSVTRARTGRIDALCHVDDFYIKKRSGLQLILPAGLRLRQNCFKRYALSTLQNR
jgi:hypothetical protein